MMIYEGIKELETEGSEHVAMRIPSSNLIQTIARLLTDISGEKLTVKRTSAMLYKTLIFNKGTPINNSIDELENDTSLARKVKGMLNEAEPFYFIYGSYVIKDINDFITTVTVQYYLVSVFRDGNNGNDFTIKITKIKHYKAEERRKGYGKILM
jgi:predicted HAD superfamily Cof-like phosphohydrolase